MDGIGLAKDLYERYAEPLAKRHGRASALAPFESMSVPVRAFWSRLAAEMERHSAHWLPNKGYACSLDPAEARRLREDLETGKALAELREWLAVEYELRPPRRDRLASCIGALKRAEALFPKVDVR